MTARGVGTPLGQSVAEGKGLVGGVWNGGGRLTPGARDLFRVGVDFAGFEDFE